MKKIFLFLIFSIFVSTSAIAEALSVTWKGALIPGGNEQSGLSCTATTNGETLELDRTSDPFDVVLSDDGLQIFTANRAGDGAELIDNNQLSMNRLGTPNEILTDIMRNGSNPTCADMEGASPGAISGGAITGETNIIEGLHIGNGGSTFMVLDTVGKIGKFNLTTPYDISTMSYETVFNTGDIKIDSMHFSRDGTKLFTLTSNTDAPAVTTYSLPAPFDISSTTQIHQVDMADKGIIVSAASHDQGYDIEFNPDGSAMFIMMANKNTANNNFVYQFSLGKNYDVSTAVKVGRWDMNDVFLNRAAGDRDGLPRGMGFSHDGMKLFVVEIKASTGVDMINQFDLECPFGIAQCTSDSTSSIGSQVELSKQNISLNISTIFKRFEWIKRNRDKENLTSHNININYPNPLLKALTKQFQPTLRKNLVALASKSEKKEKKSKWSSWSLGDLSINNYDEHGFQKAKSIKTTGLTFGSDRKFGDNKFLGLALRYGDNKSNIFNTKQNTDMESLTLNIYGIIPVNEDQYINAVVGLSALRFDNKYLGKLSGERNGKQAFTSINYRTKNSYGKLNITPTGKFVYGVTRLSKFTDFISNTIDSPARNIIYAEDTFESGEFSAGFLFEMDKMEDEQGGTFQPMGGIEILYDLSPDINYKYTYEGSTPVNKDTILGKYSKRSLKTEIGFEMIYLNGFTISPIYERIIMLSNDKEKKLYSERFIVKLSRSKEENNSEFALNFDPLSDNPANLSYVISYNDFDIKINSNYSFTSNIPDYGSNIEVSSIF